MANKNGLILIKPTSVDKTGTGSSATISANGSVTFSTCETLSLNGVFSADYDNYMIVIRSNSATGEVALRGRMRSGSSDESGSNYTLQQLSAFSTTVEGTRLTSQTSAAVSTTSATQRSGTITFMYGPFLTQPTAWRTITARGDNGASIVDASCTHSLSSSYDGLSLIASSSNFSGLLCVYGMRK